MNKILKVIILSLPFGVSLAMAAPSVSDVEFWQDPTTKVVKVTYQLSNDAGVPLLDICTNGISIGWVNLRGAYGDVNKLVQSGSEKKTIYWYPEKAWSGHSLDSGVTAVVRVWPKNNPPNVMVVNLERQYEGRDDVIQYYASFEHLPEGTVNCDAYKTARKMAFRKIPAAGIVWRMGSPDTEKKRDEYETQRKVRLTKNYYLGVFEVTQSQYERLYGSHRSMFSTDGDMRPVENNTWDDIRGKNSVWPGTTREEAYASVSSTSFLGKLRAHTGGKMFDLPTEAQWEFACREGSGATYPDGTSLATGSETSWPYLETHSRYKNNSGTDGGTGNNLSTNDATAVVGSYLASRWGLYDMLGNVCEMTLDWYAKYEVPDGVINNPCGAAASETVDNKRTMRGGSYLWGPDNVRAADRYGVKRAQQGRHIGFRVCLPLD